MEDKRILKTKRSLKKAMTEMLDREDFEHISITELCGRAEVSRITFYSHYSDKYALLDDIFNDLLAVGTEDYYRRQKENNPGGKLTAGYVNMLDSILKVYYDRFDFFQHTDPEKKSLPCLQNVQHHSGNGRDAHPSCEEKNEAEIFPKKDRGLCLFRDVRIRKRSS